MIPHGAFLRALSVMGLLHTKQSGRPDLGRYMRGWRGSPNNRGTGAGRQRAIEREKLEADHRARLYKDLDKREAMT